MSRGEALADAVSHVVLAQGLDRSPTALAARAVDGSGVFLAWGDPEVDGPVTPNTLMYAASLAKQVIGVLLSQQVDAGGLDPELPLSQYLEDLPDWADDVRVRHLIHHTAGLRPIDIPAGTGNDAVLRALRDSPGPTIKPGTKYRYSNVGYICLAEILTRISGKPVESLAQAQLFTPLGMTATRLSSGSELNRTDHQPPPATVGDGGLWTTAENLLRWNDAMNACAFGSATQKRVETPGALDDGTPLDYAWGVRVINHRERRTLSHGGSWPTWSAKTIRQPDQGTSVAILTTNEDTQAVTSAALNAATAITE